LPRCALSPCRSYRDRPAATSACLSMARPQRPRAQAELGTGTGRSTENTPPREAPSAQGSGDQRPLPPMNARIASATPEQKGVITLYGAACGFTQERTRRAGARVETHPLPRGRPGFWFVRRFRVPGASAMRVGAVREVAAGAPQLGDACPGLVVVPDRIRSLATSDASASSSRGQRPSMCSLTSAAWESGPARSVTSPLVA
jgi:hypothetical protein